MGFHGITLMVEDVERTVNFYSAAFGMKAVFADPDGTFAVLAFDDADPLTAGIPIFSVENWSKIADFAAPAPVSGIRIGFEFDDVEGAYRKAVEAGAISAKAPIVRPWGQKIAVVQDINGFLVELCEPVEYR